MGSNHRSAVGLYPARLQLLLKPPFVKPPFVATSDPRRNLVDMWRWPGFTVRFMCFMDDLHAACPASDIRTTLSDI